MKGTTMPILRRYSETLPVDLTPEQFKEKSEALANVCEEIATVEDEKAASAKQFNGKIGELETKRADLARMVRSGQEYRQVECQEEIIRDDKAVVTVRLDTGEQIRKRDAHPNELTKGKGLFDKPEDEDKPIGRDADPETTTGPVGPENEQ
jgi:hypothetical protein